MATITWTGSGSGSRGTQGLDVTLSGTQIPSGATISAITFTVGLSVNSPAGAYTQLYYLRTADSSYYFIGDSSYEYGQGSSYYAREKSTVFNNHGYYDGTNGISIALTKNLSYFVGKSSASLNVRVNNSGSGTSYVRGLQLIFTYTVNTAPTAPTIVYPAVASATTYNTKPWFRFKSGSDTESTSITTYWRVDNGTWQSYSGSEATNTDKQWTTALSTGSHTVYAYSSDGSLTSSTVSRAFTVASPISAVTAGSKIDDATIDSLQTQINKLRAYYGLTATTFTTVNGSTKALDDHIDELETAFEATPHKTNVASVDAGAKISIANINNLRTGLLNG